MTHLRRISLLSLVVISALNIRLAHAEKMNEDTQNLVIQKVERVLTVIGPKDSSYNASQQRLADLLAERARARFMQEVEANCEGCKGSSADRQRAIAIYEDLLKRVGIQEHGPILFQLAHLYEMSGKTQSAIKLFEQIIKESEKKKISKTIVTRSHAALGDLMFQTNKYAEAKRNYTVALSDKNVDNRALITYNMAWSDFNDDKLSAAILTLENLTANKNLIVRDTDEGSKYDLAFHADIMRDLATFYSRQNISDRNIEQFEKLSPVESQKELLNHFANEADRIGQKHAAFKILSKYTARKDLTEVERLDALIRVAQINYDRGQIAQSTKDFELAAKAFKQTNCKKDNKCDDLQKSMKRYVTEVHRTKKIKPDKDLLSAYITYNKTFGDDYDMSARGAQVALEIGQNSKAVELYRDIADNRSFTEKQRHEALLNEVAAAEKTPDLKLRRAAYGHFLKNSKDENKNYEVMYQVAYLSYQEKDLKTAMTAFNDIATSKKGNESLKKKAADLALDSGAQLKDDVNVQKLAWNYAKIYVQHKSEFENIARKALMNEVALVANNPKSSKGDLKSLLKKVSSTDLKTASANDKILHFKNQVVLAEKVEDDSMYLVSMNSLLGMKEVSSEEKDNLNSQLAAFHEKKLDFKNAYLSAKKVKVSKNSEKENEFRLGTLADLAQMSPQKHYQAALKAGLSGDRALVMRTRLVMLAKNQVAELKAQASELKRKPRYLNDAALMVYSRTMNKTALRGIFEMRELRNQPAGQYFKKQDLYTKLANFDREISNHKLNIKNDRNLGRSITARKALLGKAQGLVVEANRSNDITAQLMALNIFAKENQRLANDVLGTPVPKGLKPEEIALYNKALQASVAPFVNSAKVTQEQTENIWNNSRGLAQIAEEYRSARPEMQKLLNREMTILADLPGSGKLKSEINSAMRSSKADHKDLSSARRNAAENPTNVKDLKNLLQIETKMGHPLMPSYLEARLNQIQKGNSL